MALLPAGASVLNQQLKLTATGFGWDRVSFLPASWYSAVFRIPKYESYVGNTLMLQLLLSSAQQY